MKHLVLALHSGDYYQARQRRREGLPDRYRHHSYALDTLERIAAAGVRVSVIQMHSSETYDASDEAGLGFVGFDENDDASARLTSFLRRENATHFMLRYPDERILALVVELPVRTSVVLADSFPSPYRRFLRYRRLGRLLGDPRVDLVANHHLNSARQLADVLRVNPAKVIPWDWPLDLLRLASTSAKRHPSRPGVRLFYAGSINAAKGVWDLLEAVHVLRASGMEASLDIAGAGEDDALRRLIERYGVDAHVHVHGRVGGDDIIRLMQRADFVCVPSRHSYPEGLPLTIYEAMASGTPIVASDHPMFAGIVRDGQTGFVFPARKPARLAEAITRAWLDPAQYEQVSVAAAKTYATIGLSTLWGDLVERWLRGSVEDLGWLQSRALSNLEPRRK